MNLEKAFLNGFYKKAVASGLGHKYATFLTEKLNKEENIQTIDDNMPPMPDSDTDTYENQEVQQSQSQTESSKKIKTMPQSNVLKQNLPMALSGGPMTKSFLK